MIDFRKLKNDIEQRLLELCHVLAPVGRLDGNDWVGLNPTRNDKNIGSFRICLRGEKKGCWHDFASGESGDVFSLIGYCKSITNIKEIAKWGVEFLSKPKTEYEINNFQNWQKKPSQDITEKQVKYKKQALAIWLNSEKDIINTPVYEYLFNRGIDLLKLPKVPNAIRYLDKCYCTEKREDIPAMVTLITGADYKGCAIHRTYLDITSGKVKKAGLKNSKMTLGKYVGGCIPLNRGVTLKPYKQASEKDVLVVVEGIEDALSIATIEPNYRVVSAVSANNLPNIVIPSGVKRILIAHDNDKGGHTAPSFKPVMELVNRLRGEGRPVKLMPPPSDYKDWNELLQNYQRKEQ